MQTVVRIHRFAEAEYRAWRARNAQPPTGSKELARIWADELVAELTRTHGEPAGARLNVIVDPPYWVWRFNADTWVQFVVKDTVSWPFGSVSRKIVVTGLKNQPPN